MIGTAAPRDHDHLRPLGAEPVGYGAGVADRVRALAPQGVQTVLDTAGGGTLAAAAGAARPDARVASVAEVGVPGVAAVFCRLDHADLTALVRLAEAGELAVRVGARYRLERAAEAQRALAAGGNAGRVVIEVC
ncbi:zinc-binding dehydrogenase [Micromonospora psammae]|uniref:zinc-binding dehydrogenase n=1 Tax=Micromonospora sp. CPCC 205556 TaxID=3122398 RepID=UPI002FF2EBD1